MIIENEHTRFVVRHRAVCDTDDVHYRGWWRDTYEQAEADAFKHLSKHEFHQVWIETEQTQTLRSRYSN